VLPRLGLADAHTLDGAITAIADELLAHR
jgi:hypothetical protein